MLEDTNNQINYQQKKPKRFSILRIVFGVIAGFFIIIILLIAYFFYISRDIPLSSLPQKENIGNGFYKDSSGIYRKVCKRSSFGFDNSHCTQYGYEKVDAADQKTFSSIEISDDQKEEMNLNYICEPEQREKKICSGADYAKDKNFVFLVNKIIAEADPLTFKYLGRGFSIDNNSVFFLSKKIDNADVNSFNIISRKDVDALYEKNYDCFFEYWAFDKNSFYRGDFKVSDPGDPNLNRDEYKGVCPSCGEGKNYCTFNTAAFRGCINLGENPHTCLLK